MLEVLLLQLSAALDFAPVMFGPLNVAPTELSRVPALKSIECEVTTPRQRARRSSALVLISI